MSNYDFVVTILTNVNQRVLGITMTFNRPLYFVYHGFQAPFDFDDLHIDSHIRAYELFRRPGLQAVTARRHTIYRT